MFPFVEIVLAHRRIYSPSGSSPLSRPEIGARCAGYVCRSSLSLLVIRAQTRAARDVVNVHTFLPPSLVVRRSPTVRARCVVNGCTLRCHRLLFSVDWEPYRAQYVVHVRMPSLSPILILGDRTLCYYYRRDLSSMLPFLRCPHLLSSGSNLTLRDVWSVRASHCCHRCTLIVGGRTILLAIYVVKVRTLSLSLL